ncbi:hypothetical protein Pla52o_33170 [Novipirellula galeiformis]|uniref:Uncharacterized protein n=1 Tax=Novipirellula galeiformis TaxID=2528004 RepID=A0A5C6CFV4_9BACT|nr:hypothetical protein [Novipirellula galeiformis]TWU22261.1 hypothetical protein Pla52o_33170 [Novipirellula galeiformis]
MKIHQLLAELPTGSLRIYSHQQTVKQGGQPLAAERKYLELDGTPAAYRFLASLLTEMAENAESKGNAGRGQSVLLDPKDANAIAIDDYDAVSFSCRKRPPSDSLFSLGAE